MDSRVEKIVDSMTGEETAELAGEILGEVDPTKTNLVTFFAALKVTNETVYDELISRAVDLNNATG